MLLRFLGEGIIGSLSDFGLGIFVAKAVDCHNLNLGVLILQFVLE
jgi:hypothetical protein